VYGFVAALFSAEVIRNDCSTIVIVSLVKCVQMVPRKSTLRTIAMFSTEGQYSNHLLSHLLEIGSSYFTFALCDCMHNLPYLGGLKKEPHTYFKLMH
jgi:hypothetical protein